MSAYRFCRTDDIGLLVEALNRCWAPYYPDEPPATPAAFKRSIRDLQVWCSSCMVAFSGSDPIGVLIGAKRTSGTLIHRIAVHPDHVRQGHGGHLLESLASKLAILGPPADRRGGARLARGRARVVHGGRIRRGGGSDRLRARGCGGRREELPGRLVIPVTVDDLAANGLLEADAAPRLLATECRDPDGAEGRHRRAGRRLRREHRGVHPLYRGWRGGRCFALSSLRPLRA